MIPLGLYHILQPTVSTSMGVVRAAGYLGVYSPVAPDRSLLAGRCVNYAAARYYRINIFKPSVRLFQWMLDPRNRPRRVESLLPNLLRTTCIHILSQLHILY